LLLPRRLEVALVFCENVGRSVFAETSANWFWIAAGRYLSGRAGNPDMTLMICVWAAGERT